MKKIILLIFMIVLSINLVSAVWDEGLNDNLVAYYKLDESSGAVIDSHTNQLDGTNNGATQGASGKIGSAYSFESSLSEYAETPKTNITSVISINAWVKINTISGVQGIYSCGANNDVAFYINSGNVRFGKCAVDNKLSGITIDKGDWNMITVVYDGSNVNFYANGTSITNESYSQTFTSDVRFLGSSSDGVSPNYFFNGTIDEVGVWNRALTTQEVQKLWASGNGVTYTSRSLNVTLNSPDNNTDFFQSDNRNMIFNVTAATESGYNIENISLWTNLSGAWARNDTLTIDNVDSTQTYNNANDTYTTDILDPDNFKDDDFDTYSRTGPGVTGYIYENFSSSLNFLDFNITIKYYLGFNPQPAASFSVHCWNYSTSSWHSLYSISSNSLQEDTQTINVYGGCLGTSGNPVALRSTLASALYVQARYYESNATAYFKTNEVTTTFDEILAPDSNILWGIESCDTYGCNFSENRTLIYNNLSLDNCSSNNNLLLGFTLRDEDNKSLITGTSEINMELTLYDSDRSNILFIYNDSFSNLNQASVCTSFNASNISFGYSLDGIIEYSSTDRFSEFYHIERYSITNTTSLSNITLYDLNSSKGQSFKIIYKDSNFVPVEGALIHIQRKYLSDGSLDTVEIPKTSFDGSTIGHFITNDVVYNLLIYKDGELLATFNSIRAICQNPNLEECLINLNTYTSSNFIEDLTNLEDLSFVTIWNENDKSIRTTFTVPSGVSALISLNATLYDRLGNNTVCSESLNAVSGELVCFVPSAFGNSTLIVTLYKDGEIISQSIISQSLKPSTIYGNSIMFIALILFITIAGIGASSDNPLTYGFILIIGSILMVTLNLIFARNLIGYGASMLWFIVIIGLTMIKGSSRN